MRWSRYFFVPNDPGAPPPPAWAKALNFAFAALVISLVFFFSFHRLAYRLRWDSIYQYRQMFLQGWLTTIFISLAALALSTLIGLFFALAGRSHFLPLRYFSKIYVEVVRGTPLLVQILIFFYVVADAFGVGNRYLVGVLTLSFFSGAYISEIIRAGIESVGKSQLESARAIGLTRSQTYRHVIFPQALRQTLPPLAGQFVSLIKDSSLLSIISISEFTWNAEAINARTFSTLESYIPLAVGYLILTLPISIWTRHLERRHKFET
ncbi:MAG TPA: amino acid ABC transporter permease [Verrucomicrobiae bacterium]|nr:amino acid ABC transporter permease [Verrucomicrobiae bacterium]